MNLRWQLMYVDEVNFVHYCECVFDSHVLGYNEFYLLLLLVLLLQLLLESSFSFHSSRFLRVYFYFYSSCFKEAYFYFYVCTK